MRRSPERRVVLADVARIAGTSEATASRALKNDPRIGEATRAAVQAAALKLGYVPNAAARSLRARRTHILGLLVHDLADPVHGKVAAGFEEAAAAQGYAVFIMTGLHDLEREQRALTAFVEHRADGIVVASCLSDPAEVLPASRPIAWSSSSPITRPSRTASIPRRAASCAPTIARASSPWCATSWTAGYRRIAFVGPGSGSSDFLRRVGGRDCLWRSCRSDRCASSTPASMAGGMRRPSPGRSPPIRRTPSSATTTSWRSRCSMRCGRHRWTCPATWRWPGSTGSLPPTSRGLGLTTVDVPSVEVGRRAVEMLVASVRDGPHAGLGGPAGAPRDRGQHATTRARASAAGDARGRRSPAREPDP